MTNLLSDNSLDPALRELVSRLLVDYDDPEHNTQLLIGELPHNLPFSLPVTEGSAVVCSMVRYVGRQMEVFLEVDMAATEAASYYIQALTEQGFTKGNWGFHFIDTPQVLMCRIGEVAVDITADARNSLSTALRMFIRIPPAGTPCEAGGKRLSFPDAPMPTLLSPPGATWRKIGGSGGQGSVDRSAYLRTTLNPNQLSDFFSAQFETAGWLRNKDFSWTRAIGSEWLVTGSRDEKWRGVLLILASPIEANCWRVTLRLDRHPYMG